MPDAASRPVAYAHSRNAAGRRQELVAHLRGVAALAEGFAGDLGCPEIGRLLGLWHDLGKFHPAFQRYLLESEADPSRRHRGPDHKAAGASVALRRLGPLALVLQAHHGGLTTRKRFDQWLKGIDRATGRPRETLAGEALALASQGRGGAPVEDEGLIPPPEFVRRDPLAAEMFLRLLLSALVDADALDTEQHGRADLAAQRGGGLTLGELWARLEADQRWFTEGPPSALGDARREIYQACLHAADLPPGLFRLTVPTGGGKTRSAMAFALRHALRYGHRRVIVAVPYISITEQAADVYRGIFEPAGPFDAVGRAVLEHHSGAQGDDAEGEEYDPERAWARLTAENWDAPIVVTTTVQLFESLFGNRPGRCRKLHNLAHAVVILDEAQALPARLLTPILDALRELCEHYGATVVLSTATQPTFEAIPTFAATRAREIVPEPARYFAGLARVRYEWRLDPPLAWAEVAEAMRAERQALAVVNTKRDARALLDALDDPAALHLSTLLCGAHRRDVIAEVRRRLAAGEPCRLVSTQVVEAGVDLDFPLVLRALGPLDSIVQAAGRCNREGKLERGRVVVFRPAEGGMAKGAYAVAAALAERFANEHGGAGLELDDPATLGDYYRLLFGTLDVDPEGIQGLRAQLDYPEVARRFRMIDDDTTSVVVPYGTAAQQAEVTGWVERLRAHAPDSRQVLRRLQPYVVSLWRGEAQRLEGGLVEPVMPGLGAWRGDYHPVRGLTGKDLPPDKLVV